MLTKIYEKLEDASLVAIFCVLVFITSAAILPKRRAFKELMFSFFFSVPIGILVGGAANEFGFGFYTSLIIACVATIFVHPVFVAIMGRDGFLGTEVRRAFSNLIDKYTK